MKAVDTVPQESQLDGDYSAFVAREIGARRNQCFRNARLAVMAGLCDTYVEGTRGFYFAPSIDLPEGHVSPVHHAWCMHGDRIVDPSMFDLLPDVGTDFQCLFTPLVTLSRDEMMGAMLDGRISMTHWDPMLSPEDVGEAAVYDPMSEFSRA